jgi:hypothetical protein
MTSSRRGPVVKAQYLLEAHRFVPIAPENRRFPAYREEETGLAAPDPQQQQLKKTATRLCPTAVLRTWNPGLIGRPTTTFRSGLSSGGAAFRAPMYEDLATPGSMPE